MPVIDPRWEEVSHEQWLHLAEDWLAEVREGSLEEGSDLNITVVGMNFFSAPELQWKFILLTISIAETDRELAAIAGGPIEHLLGKFGEQYIDQVDNQAATSPDYENINTHICDVNYGKMR